MKKINNLRIAGLIAVTLGVFLLFAAAKGAKPVTMTKKNIDYENLWRQFDSLYYQAGLTQSAIDLTDKIYEKAKSDSNYSEMVRALIAGLTMASKKREDAYVKAIDRLNAEIGKTRFPVTPVLHVLLAEHYWQYYQQNRWRFYDRTQTVHFDLKDIHTWDLKTLFEKTMQEYGKALENPAALKALQIGAYPSVITDAGRFNKIRPTVYDVVAHRAIDFFSSEEPDIIRPAYKFELNSEDYYKPTADFVKVNITTRDTTSMKFHAIKLLRDLIAFHRGDAEPDALIDVDLERLQFVRQYAAVEGKDDLYLAALKALEEKCGAYPASAEVTYQIAAEYAARAGKYAEGQPETIRWLYKDAIAMCDKAAKKFPGSFGASECAPLKASILNKEFTFTLEQAVMPGRPSKALVRYRNISHISMRIMKIEPADYEKLLRRQDSSTEKMLQVMAALPPLHEWQVETPDPGDFQRHAAEVKIPAAGPGFYLILGATDKSFALKNSLLAFGTCWSSRISYINRDKPGQSGAHEYLVMDRESGDALKGVMAKVWSREYDYKKRVYANVAVGTFTTDHDGAFEVPAPSEKKGSREYSVDFSLGEDRLSTERNQYQYHGSPSRTHKSEQTFFFTDRSIYRPGQTVYFKGIMLSTDGEKSEILPGRSTIVYFRDVNFQEVARLEMTANAYGSFNGSFIAPMNVLCGAMSIQNGSGDISFSVEEYKRPKFDVTVNPVKGAYRLNDLVKVEGKAKAYAGSAVDGAQVKFRVTREARFPYWWCWWRPAPGSASMEILNGSTITDDTGGFSVHFKSLPDPMVPQSDNPRFYYTVYIDVTDINGETHSATASVCVAYTALNLSVNVPSQVNRSQVKAFGISTTNMNGVAEPSQGTIEIYRLKTPGRVIRGRIWENNGPDTVTMPQAEHDTAFPHDLYKNELDMSAWARSGKVFQGTFDTKTAKEVTVEAIGKWSRGAYVLEGKTRDAFGREVKDVRYFTLYDPAETALPYAQPDWFVPVKDQCEPGEKAVFLIGSGYPDVRILYEVEHKGSIVSQKRLQVSGGQRRIEIPIEEKHRGNLAVHFNFVKQNRSYRHDAIITVPWSNKELSIEFETFRSTLQPGEKEEWRLKITGPQKEKEAAEMAATLYDASLDAFKPHAWNFSIYPSYDIRCQWTAGDGFGTHYAESHDFFNSSHSYPYKSYPGFYWGEYDFSYGYYYGVRYGAGYGTGSMDAEMQMKSMPAAAPRAVAREEELQRPLGKSNVLMKEKVEQVIAGAAASPKPKEKNAAPEDLTKVASRSNLNETAFFFPDLQTDENGSILVKFTIPEALTKWKMLGFAHTKDLKFGMTANELVTQKELMVMPNAPRFFRENDTIVFSAKITNMAEKDLSGEARLFLFDAATMKPLDKEFGNGSPQLHFTVKKGLSAPLFWALTIPEGIGAVCYKVVAKADKFTDGEEKVVPVLSNRMLVTETMPLPVRKKGSAHFTFQKLISRNNGSTTLRNHRLTLEFTSNPAWYAVQALPYLMEYPYECAEQTFARYYANSIAAHIANSSPKIKKVFESWKTASPQAFLSNLEKNEELKSLVLEETPWVLDGKDETERKKRVGLLFDLNKMARDLDRAFTRLKKLQTPNGGWPWFDGMQDDRYITQYIVTGFGRLDHIKVVDLRNNDDAWTMIRRAVPYLDERIREDYDLIMREGHPELDNLDCIAIQYLYMRSFFRDIPIGKRDEAAIEYFLGQARQYWLRKTVYMQGMIALALDRWEDKTVPAKIMKSLKENSLSNEEMGMYWKEMYEGEGWFWYQAPIESQALLIEAFEEVAHDSASVDDMKTWLLKSKQTQNWKTTKATTEAVYALLLRGADWLGRDPNVTITLGDVVVDPKKLDNVKTEAGTGYFKTSWAGADVKPEMGNITVAKSEAGVAWGAVYWQYFEQLDKITSHETPLKLSRRLFRQIVTDEGVKLEPVSDKIGLKPGDKLTARIELRVDRDMEYVHMKDMRASGFEPTNVLSGYRYQDGLGYYESTRDAATNFFFSYLRKGTYVFEYPMTVTHSGVFSNGITTIQCMYAPEFSSHSEGVRVRVGK